MSKKIKNIVRISPTNSSFFYDPEDLKIVNGVEVVKRKYGKFTRKPKGCWGIGNPTIDDIVRIIKLHVE